MEIPNDRRFFRIGEVSKIVGVEPYVLRYWESEFPQIRPLRADTNQRTYQKKDVEIILEIKRLLYEEKLTIEGARQRLKQRKARKVPLNYSFFEELRKDLQGVLRILS
ncbi:MAG: MerR family transcriptional regulator [Deltaproteobacteria bacterium]|nr:MerR family transcriptional regulator [Deltaproteobacteria bacterium]